MQWCIGRQINEEAIFESKLSERSRVILLQQRFDEVERLLTSSVECATLFVPECFL
jgi:hypothetical protein